MEPGALDLYGNTAQEVSAAGLPLAALPEGPVALALDVWLANLDPALRAGRTERTWHAYATDLAHFGAWCTAVGRLPLPAPPDLVCDYLTEHAETLSIATLSRRLAAIALAHRVTGLPSPTDTGTVRLTWAGLRRTYGPARRVRRVDAIETRVLASLLAPLRDTTMDHRDRALLVLGFAGALRRSELSALDVEDVAVLRDELQLTVRRSSTGRRSAEHRDDENPDVVLRLPYGTHRETCPVRSWRAWVEAAGLTGGPAFRQMTKGGQGLRPGRLSDRGVAEVVKRRAADAGLDPSTVSV